MPTEKGLHKAIQEGRITTAAQLQNRGLDVNCTNQEGQTALHVAASYGQLALVKDLVANGAYFDMQDADGCSPLFVAAAAGRTTVVTFLLYIGADPARHDQRGWTPLQAAAYGGHKDAVRELLNSAEDTGGFMAVMLAQAQGHREIVDLLQAQRPAVRGTQADEQAREHFLRPAPPPANENNDIDPVFAHDEDFADVVDEWTVAWSVAVVVLCGVIRFVYTRWLALDLDTP